MNNLNLFPPMPTLPQGSFGITIDSASRLRELRESLADNLPQVIPTPDGIALGPALGRSGSAQ